MSVDVQTEITIRASVDRVAGYAGDPSNAPEWYANIKSIEWVTQPPAKAGSQMAFVAKFLRRELRYTYEIVELTSDRLVMRTAQGPFPMETTYTWTAQGDDTHMTLRNRGEPTGFNRVVAPLMSAAMRGANRKDLQRLKAVLERKDGPVEQSELEFGGVVTACPACGIEFRDGDDIVVVDDQSLHPDCAAPHKSDPRRQVGKWAAMGARGQMAMGDVQRDTPV